MGEIIRQKKYIDNGSFLREKEDFSYALFDNIDFTKNSQPVSFFRSDFRGAKFANVDFYCNNFDRADIISCVFIDCSFVNVDLASSEIKNCYFSNVQFINNKYNNTSIQECTFSKCKFEDENLLINMKNCSFMECILNNCKFERSTTEKIFFDKCDISLVDFANMHAERYSFKSCILTDVLIDICYIFGYMFYDTNIYDILIIYMGEKVEFTKDNMLNKFALNLWLQQRYYEFINANIIFNNYSVVPQLVQKAFTEMSNVADYSRRLEISNIFDMLQFYSMCNTFEFSVIQDMLTFFDNNNWDNLNFDEKILCLTQVQKFKLYLTELLYDEKFIESASGHISLVTFFCHTDDYDLAIKSVQQYISEICLLYGLVNAYDIIDSQKGSWIITIALVASCALLIPKVLKNYSDVIIEIDTKRKISRKLADKLNKKNLNINDLKLIAEIASSTGLVSGSEENLELSDISKIFEMIKIGI